MILLNATKNLQNFILKTEGFEKHLKDVQMDTGKFQNGGMSGDMCQEYFYELFC
jgi:hypothetical protein